MNRDDIIKLAREAAAKHGHTLRDKPEQETVEFLEAFFHAVQAVEREECAKVCDELGNATKLIYRGQAANDCAAAIRSRSKT